MPFPSSRRGAQGFSLIELMVAISVLLIIAVIALPSFQQSIERQRLTGAAETIYADFQRARSHAIKINGDVYANFNVSASGGSADWCYGLTDLGSGVCDCDTASAASCTLDGVAYVVSGARYPGISLSASATEVEFDSLRGTVWPVGGNVGVKSESGNELHVKYHFTGRIKRCVNSGDVAGFEGC